MRLATIYRLSYLLSHCEVQRVHTTPSLSIIQYIIMDKA
jgi:hypothetical protein